MAAHRRRTTPWSRLRTALNHPVVHLVHRVIQIWATWTTRAAYAGTAGVIIAIVLKSGSPNLPH